MVSFTAASLLLVTAYADASATALASVSRRLATALLATGGALAAAATAKLLALRLPPRP